MRKRAKTSTVVLLEDLCKRMQKLDERLDCIEQEISGVKKAVKAVMFLAKFIGGITSVALAIWQGLSFIMPKGKGSRGKQNRS